MNSKEQDIFNLDSYLLTANLTIVVGCLVIFQISPIKNIYEKGILAFSFGALLISFLLFLWSNHRLPIRKKYFQQLREKITEDYADKIATFAEKVVIPFSLIEKKKGTFTKEDLKERYGVILEELLELMSIKMKNNYTLAFYKPLKESHANFKLTLDLFAFKFKYHIFIIGLGALLVSVILHLLL